MITKERFQELIEKGATIYYNNTISVQDKTLDKTYQVDNGYLWRKIKNGAIKSCGYPLENLFETEEDARWELEMTATRTETLKLPTWEEFCDSGMCEFNVNNKRVILEKTLLIDFSKLNDISHEMIYVGYVNYNDTYDDLFREPLTKENYIEACKLCLRLFRGEEV